MTHWMVKVRKWFIEWFIDSNIIQYFQGKFYWKNGDRFEGEFKDGNQHGQGKKLYLLNDLLILKLFNTFIGKSFLINGNRYEGEWKDGKKRGLGQKSYLLKDLLILTLFNTFIGKYFCNNGDTYEGEWEVGWINGKGKKFNSKGELIEEGNFADGVLIKNSWITINISSYYF